MPQRLRLWCGYEKLHLNRSEWAGGSRHQRGPNSSNAVNPAARANAASSSHELVKPEPTAGVDGAVEVAAVCGGSAAWTSGRSA